ncbi:MAG: DMT family protein, partial [Mycobacteriales bacterium]
MSTAWAVPAALGASVCYAAGLVLQHNEAARSSEAGKVRVAGLVGLLAQPVWLLGIAFDGAGLALHVLALGLGPVSLVQPLQVTSLLFALLLGAAINRRPIRSGELEAGLLIVAGVGAFLALTRPGVTTAALPRATAGLLAAVSAATMAVVTVAVRHARPEWRA